MARDRHAQLLAAIATLGACVEQIATEVRLLSRTEVREVEEPRTAAYQGSSAMPHKRNPTTSERLCGLARLLRGYAGRRWRTWRCGMSGTCPTHRSSEWSSPTR